jgi:DNA-binding CsgD family transcriptional regulator
VSERLGILIEQFIPFEAHLLDRVSKIDLSIRQREVVLLSARGLSNAKIAAQMNISPHTLKDYFKTIYGRLGITSQQQLMELLAIDS